MRQVTGNAPRAGIPGKVPGMSNLQRILGIVLMLLAGAALAQSFPSRPIRIVVPYPPGGGTDVLARLVGRYMSDSFNQPVLVENRAGGNAKIGMEVVAKAPPDGYTLMAIAAGPLNEDNIKAFAPIALMAAPSYLLVVHPSVKANSVRELIALAKSQPGKIAYGSTGGGAASHLATELFRVMAGIELLHVPYKGVGQAVGDLLGGQVQMMIAPAQAVVPQVKSGRLRALAVSSAKRLSTLPDLPTIAEAGVPGYESVGWFGLMLPAGTAADIVTRLNREVNRILTLPEVRERLLELGADPASTAPAQFGDFIRRENTKWAKFIQEQGIVVEGQ
jgi:tripartite-type tricarboxylate transporter receptor subunit TctC